MDNNKENLKDTFNDIFSIPDKLTSDEDPMTLLKADDKNNKPAPKKSNYAEQRTGLYKKAKKTINSILDFYFNESIISEDDYIRQKAIQDEATLGDLMAQIEISNRAITTLMENIDMGDMAPRMFEVLSDAQKTFIELLKMRSMHLINMEENYKKLIQDREIYNQKSNTEEKTTGGITMRGSKKLMQQLQDAMKNEEIDEADIAEDE